MDASKVYVCLSRSQQYFHMHKGSSFVQEASDIDSILCDTLKLFHRQIIFIVIIPGQTWSLDIFIWFPAHFIMGVFHNHMAKSFPVIMEIGWNCCSEVVSPNCLKLPPLVFQSLLNSEKSIEKNTFATRRDCNFLQGRWNNLVIPCICRWEQIIPMVLYTSFNFYPRPVLAFGYCRCLRLSVCVSVCASITCLSAR